MRRFLGLVVVLVVGMGILAACGGQTEQDDAREQSVEMREDTFEQAVLLHPVPPMENFPLREALVEFASRQDRVGTIYYVYLVDMNGQPYGYFTGQTYPINTCNFLSSSERIVWNSETDPVVSAPSLDGMFYGGAESSAACDLYFFFDSATDAMHVFKAQNFFVSDQPLNLDVPKIEAMASPTS
jgi:hypothetical protein